MDPKVNKLARFRGTKSGKTGKNASRDFHRFLRREGKMFNVKISTPEIPIRRKVRGKHGRRCSHEFMEKHPCLYLSSWIASIFGNCPKFLLGGHDPRTAKGLLQAENMLKEFWANFASVQPSHPIFERSPQEQMRTLPVAIHGDEGRGLGKVPVLVLSYQLLIPYTGPNRLNSTTLLGWI